MSVSLDSKKIEFNNTYQYEFEVEDNLLERIVLGLDDVDMTLKYKNDIKLFEDLRKKEKPWIYADE
jgi:3-isopropylmalate dehydratase small subunit